MRRTPEQQPVPDRRLVSRVPAGHVRRLPRDARRRGRRRGGADRRAEGFREPAAGRAHRGELRGPVLERRPLSPVPGLLGLLRALRGPAGVALVAAAVRSLGAVAVAVARARRGRRLGRRARVSPRTWRVRVIPGALEREPGPRRARASPGVTHTDDADRAGPAERTKPS